MRCIYVHHLFNVSFIIMNNDPLVQTTLTDFNTLLIIYLVRISVHLEDEYMFVRMVLGSD
jgi:hypothetical protein